MQDCGKFIQSYKKRTVPLCVCVSLRCKCYEVYEKMVALIHVFSTPCLLQSWRIEARGLEEGEAILRAENFA